MADSSEGVRQVRHSLTDGVLSDRVGDRSMLLNPTGKMVYSVPLQAVRDYAGESRDLLISSDFGLLEKCANSVSQPSPVYLGEHL